MCGRFSLATDMELLHELFEIEMNEALTPRYNIAPSQPVLSIINSQDGYRAGFLRWGLIPPWSKDEKIGYKMINARSETLDERKSFKKPLQSKRCLILADGFYEWKKEGSVKTPYRFIMKNQRPFAFAGLYEKWQNGSETIFNCTIITTEPNDLTKKVHDRSPVILTKEEQSSWLDRNEQDLKKLKQLLKPYPATEMEMYQVSSFVNSPKNDNKTCIEPVKK
ncbi:SOS response-associated peptidase [Bacillus carboniphilus]|uniref:Abasic site processing protein n=1 Tax=Bacillus carboniphilus TaxID=86663 RepID=A0ABY9JWR7_9BACI|nr:SOS response-associated peptidase [Bacillus carboniphilus]WLR42121.1 SOS response-associated peptidase [Bacillus carboniphilus]